MRWRALSLSSAALMRGIVTLADCQITKEVI
jgi:hypothetical protein